MDVTLLPLSHLHRALLSTQEAIDHGVKRCQDTGPSVVVSSIRIAVRSFGPI